jgi:hypothetical protein
MSDDHDNYDCGVSSIERRRFVQGCGAALAFAAAGTSLTAVKAQETKEESAIERLLADAPKNWGRWGENDELGALNLLGSEEAFAGMRAAMQGGKKSIERFTLQQLEEHSLFLHDWRGHQPRPGSSPSLLLQT